MGRAVIGWPHAVLVLALTALEFGSENWDGGGRSVPLPRTSPADVRHQTLEPCWAMTVSRRGKLGLRDLRSVQPRQTVWDGSVGGFGARRQGGQVISYISCTAPGRGASVPTRSASMDRPGRPIQPVRKLVVSSAKWSRVPIPWPTRSPVVRQSRSPSYAGNTSPTSKLAAC